MTTACCEYKGLPDDCHELQTLRKFRDEYLALKKYGDEIIRLYYEDAPQIVKSINGSDEKEQIYDQIYNKIKEIVHLIEIGEFDKAIIVYMLMVYQLKRNI